LQNLLQKLHTTGRLMQTTAHPDDEDSGFLVYESRGRGAEVMLFTLTRGEGGQNKTGSNFFDELGVLRTLELMAAGRYDQVQQRFSRVADFGFSKNPNETFEKWGGHEIPLADMVRVIREFRPDVLVARFSGTPRDGHGHHQASAILTPEAARAAADPSRFPEQIRQGLHPWQVKKVYVLARGEDATFQVDAGQNHAPLGMSYAQFGVAGFNHQRSQGGGSFQVPPGPSLKSYKLVDSVFGEAKAATHEEDIFQGIDTSLPGLLTKIGDEAGKFPSLKSELSAIDGDVSAATDAAAKNSAAAFAPLAHGLTQTHNLIQRLNKSTLSQAAKEELVANLETKEKQFEVAAGLAAGLELTLTAKQAEVVPGENFTVTVKLHNEGRLDLSLKEVVLDLPKDWSSTALELLAGGPDPKVPLLAAGASVSIDFRVTLARNAEYTRPYWHRNSPETDNVFIIDNAQYDTLPLPPPPVQAHVLYKDASVRDDDRTDWATLRTFYDIGEGDKQRPVAVVPAFSVLLQHAAQVVPLESDGKPIAIKINVTHEESGEASGKLTLKAAEWKVEPHSDTAKFVSRNEEKRFPFSVKPSALREGSYEASAVLASEGKKYSEGFTKLSREDLPNFYYYQPASQKLSVVDVKVPKNLKVGYLAGAGDDIPPVLTELGIDLQMIPPEQLTSGDLSGFDTIVLGIRAYDTRTDLRSSNKRLLDYVANGGTLIVQNNASVADFNSANLTPYPAQLGRERVSVETQPVEILAASDPLFHYPNQITARDFEKWVQERGVNFMSQWDSHYEPLLASNDPGEPSLKGGLLRARVGKGTYIYTGYAFFRQLPAGVPGAIRLYVNLLSAGHEQR
jgi:LmbE family N-acetylglucosaminyl deacetylase